MAIADFSFWQLSIVLLRIFFSDGALVAGMGRMALANKTVGRHIR